MSGLDLDAIRVRARDGWPTSHDVEDLLAEVDRLRSDLAAIREAAVVASYDTAVVRTLRAVAAAMEVSPS